MKRIAREALADIAVSVDGVERTGRCEPRMLLSDFLRQELGRTGTHVGCEHGVCGACTVLVDGDPQRSCMQLAVQAEGRSLVTVEGLAARDGTLSDLQEAFRRHFALQCGFCTAGILVSCHAFLRRHPQPTEAEVRVMLSGHLCRCTGYTPIIAAVMDVARERLARTPADA